MTSGINKSKMVYAIHFMLNTKKYKISSRIYHIIKVYNTETQKNRIQTPEQRRKNSEWHKERCRLYGQTKGNAGNKHTEETKKLMREKRKLQIITQETKDILSNYMKNLVSTGDFINPMDLPGVAEKHKMAMNIKKQCPFCGEWAGPSLFGRKHGNKCAKKI